MNKLKERIRSLKSILAIGATILCSISAWAAEWTDASGNVWTYDGGQITGVSFETTSLVMPETLGGNPVTSFTSQTFAGKERAVRVTIPATVTSIPAGAFAGCSNLKSVTINGTGLKSIGATAFSGCSNLEAFVMPHSVETVGQGVFSGCTSLESVTLSDKLETLPDVEYNEASYINRATYRDNGSSLSGDLSYSFFYNCTSLKTINWGKSIKSIGNIAFLNCSSLESVTIPDTVTTIGRNAFMGCTGLTNVKIGNTVESIYRMAFYGLPNLTKVTFGAKVKKVGYSAFANCVNLQNFTLPNTVQYIETQAFAGCNKALIMVTIPANKDELDTELGQGVFSGCTKLETVTFGDTVKIIPDVEYNEASYINRATYRDNGSSLSGDLSYGFFYNCTSLKTINWGKSIKSIGNIAFLNCSSLESITIPDTVTAIGCNAFMGCTGLTNVKIGNTVESIYRMAFYGLPNLTKVTFGAKVKKVGYRTFANCVNLQNFTLPNTVQYIETQAFAGCNKALTMVTIPANKDELDTELGQGVFSGCTKLETVTFGDTVKIIPDVEYSKSSYTDRATYRDNGSTLSGDLSYGFFYNCTSLKTINWGKSIKSIGNIAFLNCSALTDVTLPANVDTIGNHAFYGCSSLKAVVAEGSINSIGRRAFGNCPALHYVDFRGPVMDFEPGAEIFAFCNDRVTVYAAEGSTGWTGVAGVTGLPSNGTWGGARITYAPPPEGAGNPYDFYPCVLTDRVSYKDYVWPSPVLLTTNRYVNGRTIPTTCATIREGSPIYLSYAFDEYWRGEAFTVTNRFTLSCAKSGTFDYKHSAEAHGSYPALYETNATPALLQNLAPGNYTLTLKMNVDNRLPETDYANNTTSITFTIVAVPKYKVSFNLNGSSGTAPVARTVYEGRTIGELPTVTAPAGWTFLGWYTAATGGTKITSSQIINSAQTYYAHWSKCDMGFYTPDGWSQPFYLTSTSSSSVPKTSFKVGESIYLNYAFSNLASADNMSNFVNRFKLNTGAYYDDSWNGYTLNLTQYDYGWLGSTNPRLSFLQNLPTGTYTLTCTLDVTGVLSEVSEGNNTRSITFMVGTPASTTYLVKFNANGGSVSTASRSVVSGKAIGSLPQPTRSGYTFAGWFTAATGGNKISSSTIVTGNITYYAHWTQNSSGGEKGPFLFTEAEGDVPVSAASVYDGYLYYNDKVAGSIQAKISKPKLNKKLGVATAKTSVTIQITGEKKVSLKGEMDVETGDLVVAAKDGRVLDLVFGEDGMIGEFGQYEISAARNFFSSKDKTESKAAEEILAPWLGTFNMITDGGTLSVTLAKKGKVTIKGTIDGGKVSAKSQLLIGEEWMCIPVVYSKKTVNLAFTIWLSIDGGEAEIIGLDDAVIGKAGTLKNGARFIVEGDIGDYIETEDERTLELLPNGEIVTVSGSKWLVADGIKPAKVAYKKGEFTITEGRKGAGIANPSGLKLTYKSKDGSFKGSFTAYGIVKGKLKKHKASVEGVLVNGVGYGTITIKRIGTWAVTIK